MRKQFILTFVAFFFVSAFIVWQSGMMDAVTATNINESTISVENVSFENDIQPILERRCAKCHGGDFPSEGLNMESYETLMSGSQYGQVIIAGDSSNSLLFEKIESGEMPKRGSNLTAAQIELIKQWIDQGALNN